MAAIPCGHPHSNPHPTPRPVRKPQTAVNVSISQRTVVSLGNATLEAGTGLVSGTRQTGRES